MIIIVKQFGPDIWPAIANIFAFKYNVIREYQREYMYKNV